MSSIREIESLGREREGGRDGRMSRTDFEELQYFVVREGEELEERESCRKKIRENERCRRGCRDLCKTHLVCVCVCVCVCERERERERERETQRGGGEEDCARLML